MVITWGSYRKKRGEVATRTSGKEKEGNKQFRMKLTSLEKKGPKESACPKSGKMPSISFAQITPWLCNARQRKKKKKKKEKTRPKNAKGGEKTRGVHTDEADAERDSSPPQKKKKKKGGRGIQ